MTLIILQDNAHNQWIDNEHTPQHSESSSEIYVWHLLRVQLPNGTQHYDALVPVDSADDQSNHSSAKRKNFVQRDITKHFKKCGSTSVSTGVSSALSDDQAAASQSAPAHKVELC